MQLPPLRGATKVRTMQTLGSHDSDGRPEPFVTEREASLFLKLSTRTLQRWRLEPPPNGAPIFYRLGAKRVAYRLSDLSLWAEAQGFASTAEADAAAAADSRDSS